MRKSPGDFHGWGTKEKHTKTHRESFEADGHGGCDGSSTPDSGSSTDTIIVADTPSTKILDGAGRFHA